MTSKDSHDPGWNDPPIFTYDKATAIQAAATRKGISLNKRVAFPMSGSVGSNSSSPVDLARPPPMSQLPLLPSPPSVSSVSASQSSFSSASKIITKDKLEEVLRNLQIESNCDDEIAKRIKIMEKMWVDDKLDGNVRLRILELSEALAKGDAETADHIQKGLMVDYVSQCSSWMSGIRHLINQRKKEKINLEN